MEVKGSLEGSNNMYFYLHSCKSIMLFVYIKMTFAEGAERGGALKSVCRNMLAGSLYFPFPFLSERAVQWRLSLARLPLRT